MKDIFDSTARPPYQIGYFGPAEDVAAWAKSAKPAAGHVMNGCRDAYLDGHPEQLRTFCAAFMSEKIKDIWYSHDRISSGQNYYMGAGHHNAFTALALPLIEAARNPAEAVRDICADMPTKEYQIALNMLLISAVWHNKKITAQSVLSAGADVNASGGYARSVAQQKNGDLKPLFDVTYTQPQQQSDNQPRQNKNALMPVS